MEIVLDDWIQAGKIAGEIRVSVIFNFSTTFQSLLKRDWNVVRKYKIGAGRAYEK